MDILMKFFSELKDLVWLKGHTILEQDPQVWRIDDFGNIIKYEEYGKETQFGWEIDHKKPKALGGGDSFSNLRPLQSSKNASLGGRLGSIIEKK